MIHVVFFVLLSFLVNFDLNAPPSNPNKVVRPDGRMAKDVYSPFDEEARALSGGKKSFNISPRVDTGLRNRRFGGKGSDKSSFSDLSSAGSTNSSIGNSSQGSVQFDAPWESTSRSPRSQREAWEGSSPDKAWPLPRRSRSGSIYEGKTDDAWDLPEKSTPRLGGRPRPSREIDEGSKPDEPWALSRRNSLPGLPSEVRSDDDVYSKPRSAGWLSNVKRNPKAGRYEPSDGQVDQAWPLERRSSSILPREVFSDTEQSFRKNERMRVTIPPPMDPAKAIKVNR